jgi:hypothetical protein
LIGSFSIAGSGQSLQGSPGHKQPSQAARTGNAKVISPALKTEITLVLNSDSSNIPIPFIKTINSKIFFHACFLALRKIR